MTMFNESRFSQIKFLEGRWQGVGHAGKDFFDVYVWLNPLSFAPSATPTPA